jgi:WD40 repeat protein
MRRLQFLICLCFTVFPSVSLAQDTFLPDLEPISAINLESIEQLAMFHRGTIEEMSWSPDSQYLAVGGSAGGWIYTAGNLQAEPIHFAQFMSVSDLDFHPDGSRIISTGDDGAVYEWDVTTGNLIREIAPEEYNECLYCQTNVYTVKYSPDGRYIAIGALNANTLLLDSSNLHILASIPERSYELFFSPDGRYIAAKDAVSGNLIHIWSLESLLSDNTETFQVIDGLPIEIWTIAWTADSESLLITGFLAEQLYRYDLVRQTISSFGEGSAFVAASSEFIAISYDEYDMHSGEWLRFIKILEPNVGDTLHQFEIFMEVTDLRFSPNGQYLAISAPDGSIQLGDYASLGRRVA